MNPLAFPLPSRVMSNSRQGPNTGITEKEEKEIINSFLMELDWDTTTTNPSMDRLKQLNLETIK